MERVLWQRIHNIIIRSKLKAYQRLFYQWWVRSNRWGITFAIHQVSPTINPWRTSDFTCLWSALEFNLWFESEGVFADKNPDKGIVTCFFGSELDSANITMKRFSFVDSFPLIGKPGKYLVLGTYSILHYIHSKNGIVEALEKNTQYSSKHS